MATTFLSKLKFDLEKNGMFENQARLVIERMILGESDSSMASRWGDDPEGYPTAIYTLAWLTCKQYALAYIDEVCPAAWFRPCFLQPAEQEAFIKAQSEKAKTFADYCVEKEMTVGDSPTADRYVVEYPTVPFCLEDGGAYYNRLGEIVIVKQVSDSEKFPFERTNGGPERYMADGRYSDSVGEPINDLDLVRGIFDGFGLNRHQKELMMTIVDETPRPGTPSILDGKTKFHVTQWRKGAGKGG